MSSTIHKPRNVAQILGGESNATERVSGAAGLAALQAKARTKGATVQGRTTLEDSFVGFLRLHAPDLAPPVEQFRYVEGRKFTADFAWPDARLLVFCEGGVFTGQAHGSITGILKDVERSQLAAASGWRVFRITSECLKKRPLETVARLREAMEAGR